MRINIYSEEMTAEAAWIEKSGVLGHDGRPVTFYGLRIFLASPSELHHSEEDDDRSAITFWDRDATALRHRMRQLVGLAERTE